MNQTICLIVKCVVVAVVLVTQSTKSNQEEVSNGTSN